MKRIISLIALTLLVCLSLSARRTGPWPKEKAWEWYESQPWIRGCNYMSADCANRVDQWQKRGFEERLKTQEQELALAKSIGFNTLRLIFAEEGFGVWYYDRKGFMERFERTLQLCDKYGFRAIIVLGNDCSRPKQLWKLPKPGKQSYDWGYHGGRKQSQHGSFPGAIGYTCLDDPKLAPKFYEMCREVITKYKDDDRILFWNLWNEPGNNNRGELTAVNMPKLFELAWEIDPKQPLAADVWYRWGQDNLSGDLSDIISYHLYRPLSRQIEIVEDLKARYGRPLVNTEWMARIIGCDIDDTYPYFEQERIGCTMWGFVAGKYQTYEPWEGMWKRIENGEGQEYKMTKWFHDLYRPSLRPYDPYEISVISHVNHQADQEDGLADGMTSRKSIAASFTVISEDMWHGYRRTAFNFNGHVAWLVEPGIAAPSGAPWVLAMSCSDEDVERTAVTDILRMGWHYAAIDCSNDANRAEVLASFRKFLTEKLLLAPKTVLYGFGEDACAAVEFASGHSSAVNGIYFDSPVFGSGSGRDATGSAKSLAPTGIPVLLMYGTADTIAAPDENAEAFARVFEADGGCLKLIPREEYGHRPYGLDLGKVEPITDFLMSL